MLRAHFSFLLSLLICTKQTDAQLRTSSFYRRIRHHPQLSDLSHATPYPGQSGAASPLGQGPNSASTNLTFDSLPDNSIPSVQVGNNTLYPELRTPKLCGLAAVRYEILDLDRHMDSSEMTPKGEYHVDSLGGPMLLVMCYGKVWFLGHSWIKLIYRMERHRQIGRRELGILRRLHHSIRDRYPGKSSDRQMAM